MARTAQPSFLWQFTRLPNGSTGSMSRAIDKSFERGGIGFGSPLSTLRSIFGPSRLISCSSSPGDLEHRDQTEIARDDNVDELATICPNCIPSLSGSAPKLLPWMGKQRGRLMRPYLGKRAVDLMAAGMACVVFVPLAAGIGVATWLEDGGPPLFLQTRVGHQRRPFTVFKFRTMRGQQVTHV